MHFQNDLSRGLLHIGPPGAFNAAGLAAHPGYLPAAFWRQVGQTTEVVRIHDAAPIQRGRTGYPMRPACHVFGCGSLVVHRWLVVVLDFISILALYVEGDNSVLDFKTHAGQVAVQKIKVGGAGFFLIVGGQQVDGVQGGDHLIFAVELVVAVFN